ncbi:MAG TPA: hypothetical protein VH418_12885, partial [Solirubrobacteraceae bacterium]
MPPPASVAEPTSDVDRQGPGTEAVPARSFDAARAADRGLDAMLVAFAVWTVVYDVCLVLRVPAVWAAVAWAVVLGGCAWVAWRARPRAAEPHPQAPTGPSHHSPAPAAL